MLITQKCEMSVNFFENWWKKCSCFAINWSDISDINWSATDINWSATPIVKKTGKNSTKLLCY